MPFPWPLFERWTSPKPPPRPTISRPLPLDQEKPLPASPRTPRKAPLPAPTPRAPPSKPFTPRPRAELETLAWLAHHDRDSLAALLHQRDLAAVLAAAAAVQRTYAAPETMRWRAEPSRENLRDILRERDRVVEVAPWLHGRAAAGTAARRAPKLPSLRFETLGDMVREAGGGLVSGSPRGGCGRVGRLGLVGGLGWEVEEDMEDPDFATGSALGRSLTHGGSASKLPIPPRTSSRHAKRGQYSIFPPCCSNSQKPSRRSIGKPQSHTSTRFCAFHERKLDIAGGKQGPKYPEDDSDSDYDVEEVDEAGEVAEVLMVNNLLYRPSQITQVKIRSRARSCPTPPPKPTRPQTRQHSRSAPPRPLPPTKSPIPQEFLDWAAQDSSTPPITVEPEDRPACASAPRRPPPPILYPEPTALRIIAQYFSLPILTMRPEAQLVELRSFLLKSPEVLLYVSRRMAPSLSLAARDDGPQGLKFLDEEKRRRCEEVEVAFRSVNWRGLNFERMLATSRLPGGKKIKPKRERYPEILGPTDRREMYLAFIRRHKYRKGPFRRFRNHFLTPDSFGPVETGV